LLLVHSLNSTSTSTSACPTTPNQPSPPRSRHSLLRCLWPPAPSTPRAPPPPRRMRHPMFPGAHDEHPHPGAPSGGSPPPIDGPDSAPSSHSSSSSATDTDSPDDAASTHLRALLSTQPVPVARACYTLKTSRPPPKGFDAFFPFAQERRCLVDGYAGCDCAILARGTRCCCAAREGGREWGEAGGQGSNGMCLRAEWSKSRIQIQE
jgi:hypothetical protein